MKIIRNIFCLSLLVVYICSIFSIKSFHFHEHDHSNHNYTELTSCEKTINYIIKDIKCLHESHFTTLEEKCFACDKHTFSPHIKNTYSFYKILNTITSEYIELNSMFVSKKLICKKNKSPPLLS